MALLIPRVGKVDFQRMVWPLVYSATTLSILICLLAAAGMIFQIDWLTRLNPSGAPMMLLTFLLLMLVAVALIVMGKIDSNRLARRLVQSAGFLVFMTGILVIIEYALDVQLKIDLMAFPDEPALYPYPGRPAPETAVCLVFLGLAIILTPAKDSRLRGAAKFLAMVASGIPVISITSYYFGADALYTILNFNLPVVGTAFNTAICLILLGTAVILVNAGDGFTKVLVSGSLAGIAARRTILTLFLAPPLFGTFFSILNSYGIIGLEVSLALTALSTLGLLVVVSWTATLHIERLEAERNLAFEKLIQAREDVLAIVSHDIRNPLSAVLGFAGLLKERLRDQPESLKLLNHLENAAFRIQHMSRDLLDLAKIEAGKIEVIKKPLAAEALTDDLYGVFAVLAHGKGIHYEQVIPGNLPRIYADRERLFQVLSNLIGNAIKFTPQGGSIALRADPDGDEWVRFSVTDSGSGVKPEVLPHVFERYWRPKESAKSGTGLGLFIAKGIVEAHGGTIKARSIPGVQTTFEFTVPVDKGSNNRRAPERPNFEVQ
jgi:signal transduction histidine kinase